MYEMLRRARERREERERTCPCKQTCLCHRPEPGIPFWIVPVFFLVLFGGIALCGPLPSAPNKRYVRVGTKICEVFFMRTGRTCAHHLLHDECTDEGYDQAICPR